MFGLIVIVVIILIGVALYSERQRRIRNYKLPTSTRQLLTDNVPFYNTLDDNNKALFETRIKDFLARTTIRGVDTEVEDLDRILIASGGIILIFSFPTWRYNNLTEVLLYKAAFNIGYGTNGKERYIIGMVGEGAMNGKMILSRPALRSSFQSSEDGRNTVIHEFAHLIDKADGVIDGVPDYLLRRPYLLPWLNRVQETILEMKVNGRSDIDYYGATNEAEFFAVVSEYFFERPDKLQENHPKLYTLLNEMFHPKAG